MNFSASELNEMQVNIITIDAARQNVIITQNENGFVMTNKKWATQTVAGLSFEEIEKIWMKNNFMDALDDLYFTKKEVMNISKVNTVKAVEQVKMTKMQHTLVISGFVSLFLLALYLVSIFSAQDAAQHKKLTTHTHHAPSLVKSLNDAGLNVTID